MDTEINQRLKELNKSKRNKAINDLASQLCVSYVTIRNWRYGVTPVPFYIRERVLSIIESWKEKRC